MQHATAKKLNCWEDPHAANPRGLSCAGCQAAARLPGAESKPSPFMPTQLDSSVMDDGACVSDAADTQDLSFQSACSSGSELTEHTCEAGPSSPSHQAAKDPEVSNKGRGCQAFGCAHYRRRCQLVAPCCGDVVWCRWCHNDKHNDNEQDPKKRHVLDRKAVKEVVCALCDLRQPSAASCSNCGVDFGQYACLSCNFFDDDVSKKQFHCDQCGICRVGGRDNYFHCDTCNCCYAKQLRDVHVCVENSMHHNCPVCFEFLFDSVKPINVLRCGHTIHQDCLRNLAEHHSYVCPVCNKSYMSPENLARLWADMDTAVQQTPMPEEYRGYEVNVLCNDCGARSVVKFHVVGHKCKGCGGYNTRRV